MSGFNKETLQLRCLKEFWIYQDSKYAMLTQGSKENVALKMLDRNRNTLKFLIWPGSKYARITEESEQKTPL